MTTATTEKDLPAPVRVLIVKMSSLGDLFHALPAVHALRTGLPAIIDWVVNTEYADLVKCFTDVNRVIAFPRHKPMMLPAFRNELRKTEYDLIIDLQGLLKSAAVCRMARGARRIGPSFHREGSKWFYDFLAGPRNRQRHAVEENLDTPQCLDLPDAPVVFPVEFPAVEIPEPEPRVALMPFSRWPSKNWPVGAFTELAREISDRTDAAIFIMGTAADTEAGTKMANIVRGNVTNMAGKLSLPELGAWLSAMQLVITNDSGPMHMAAAVNTPVLALFGPTDPKRTGPYGEQHTVFKGRLLCQPCYRRKCKFNEASCLTTIAPGEVVATAFNILMQHTTITVK